MTGTYVVRCPDCGALTLHVKDQTCTRCGYKKEETS